MQQVERLWAIENHGLAGDSNMCMSVEDKKALAIMERSVKLDQGHYQVALTSPSCTKQAWQDQSSLRLCSQVRRNIS